MEFLVFDVKTNAVFSPLFSKFKRLPGRFECKLAIYNYGFLFDFFYYMHLLTNEPDPCCVYLTDLNARPKETQRRFDNEPNRDSCLITKHP